MRYLLNVAATKEIEDRAEEAGCTRAELMNRAGLAVARHVYRIVSAGRVVVITGFGNNGGDGWVAAAELMRLRRQVEVIAAASPDQLRGIAADAAHKAVAVGVPFTVTPSLEDFVDTVHGAALVVDAMLGTGFHGDLRPPFDEWCSTVNRTQVPVLSVDVPSGLYPDSGDAAWGAVQATATMACIAVKPGMVGGAGGILCGRVYADDLGCLDLLGQEIFTLHSSGGELEPEDFRDLVPLPDPASNKYSRGELLVVAGSTAFTGAPMLCSLAAARAGAGYVTLAVPEPIVPIMQSRLLSIPVRGLEARGGVLDRKADQAACELAGKAQAVVVGPGLGRSSGVQAVVSALLMSCPSPLLVDADGLYLLALLADNCIARAEKRRALVFTPHFGELARLAQGAGIDTSMLPQHATDVPPAPTVIARLAVQVARAYGATVVAKGPVPVVTNGATTLFSADGSSALSTAGTGDVLAGIIGSLMAQGLDPLQAAMLGLHYGGLSAHTAINRRTACGVIAEDVIDNIGAAIASTLAGPENLLARKRGA